jgi:hypothetical protein
MVPLDIIVLIIPDSGISAASEIEIPVPGGQLVAPHPYAPIQIEIGSGRKVIVDAQFRKIDIANHFQPMGIEPWRRGMAGP